VFRLPDAPRCRTFERGAHACEGLLTRLGLTLNCVAVGTGELYVGEGGDGGCNGKGYPGRTNFHDAPFFRSSRLKLAVFCVLLSEPDPKCALTPSDPKIRAGKLNIFALTRAVLRTLKKHIRPAP